MIKKEFVFPEGTFGMHLMTARHIKKIADRYPDVKIYLEKDGNVAGARSILSVAGLEIGAGDKFSLVIEGTDDERVREVLEEFEEFFEKKLIKLEKENM